MKPPAGCQEAPSFLQHQASFLKPTGAPALLQHQASLRALSYPTAAPVLLQHQACCSTRPLRVKSKSYWSTSPAAVRSQSCCSTSPAAAPGLPHSGSSRPLAWVPSRERPGASCGHPGAGSRHQAPGSKQAPGSRQGGERSKKMPRQSSKRSFTQTDAKITAQCYCFADRFTGVCCLPMALKHAYTNLHQILGDVLQIVPPSFKSRAGPKVCENPCTVLRFC